MDQLLILYRVSKEVNQETIFICNYHERRSWTQFFCSLSSFGVFRYCLLSQSDQYIFSGLAINLHNNVPGIALLLLRYHNGWLCPLCLSRLVWFETGGNATAYCNRCLNNYFGTCLRLKYDAGNHCLYSFRSLGVQRINERKRLVRRCPQQSIDENLCHVLAHS